MSKTTVEALSWNRYRVSGLSIVPSLAGQSHPFRCDNKAVEIRLPALPRPLPRGQLESDGEIWCSAWRKSGRPIRLEVRSVEVLVGLNKRVRIPTQARGNVNTTLFSAKERKRLDRLSEKGESIASQALDRWVRILRWKTRHYEIGQPESIGRESGWGTYLWDAASNQRFYASAMSFAIFGSRAVSKGTWRKAGEALVRGDIPPPWFDFLFEGEHAILSGDLQGGLIRLAVSVESNRQNAFDSLRIKPREQRISTLAQSRADVADP